MLGSMDSVLPLGKRLWIRCVLDPCWQVGTCRPGRDGSLHVSFSDNDVKCFCTWKWDTFSVISTSSLCLSYFVSVQWKDLSREPPALHKEHMEETTWIDSPCVCHMFWLTSLTGPRFRGTVVPRSQTSFGETEAWTIVLGTWRMEKSKRLGKGKREVSTHPHLWRGFITESWYGFCLLKIVLGQKKKASYPF